MRKIAIVRRNGLGDLLCTFPLLHYLTLAYPGAKMTLFLDESNAVLAPYLPFEGQIVVFAKKKNKYLHLLLTALRYRREKFDLAISAKTSPMKLMNLFLFFLGAKRRVAYVDKHWSSLLINEGIFYDVKAAKNKHQALRALQLVAPQFKSVPPRFFPKIGVSKAKGELQVLISASTTRHSSCLETCRYAALVNRLYKEEGPFFVRVVSLPMDEERARAIARELTIPHALHFPSSFENFMRIIGECSLFFCGDGGLAHLGAAMDKTCVVLFGGVRPIEWAPLGNSIEILYDPVHVNRLSDESIFLALKQALHQLEYNDEERRDVIDSGRCNSHQPFST